MMDYFTKILDDIDKKAIQKMKVEECDYIGPDGVLYCGKCHTPRNIIINFAGCQRIGYVLCRCRAKANEDARRKKLADERRKNCFPSCEMEKWTFQNDDSPNSEMSMCGKRFVENFDRFYKEGKGVLLFGSTGVGKTYCAAAIANALIDEGFSVKMANIRDIEADIWNARDKSEYLEDLNKNHLLVIDDYGSERDTEYMNDIVYYILDFRYRLRMPVLITSNLTSEQLKNPADLAHKRVYSRIYEMCVPIHCEGKDRREKELRKNVADFGEILRGAKKTEG